MAVKLDTVKLYNIKTGIMLGKVDVSIEEEGKRDRDYVTTIGYLGNGEVIMGTIKGGLIIMKL